MVVVVVVGSGGVERVVVMGWYSSRRSEGGY